MKKQYKYNFYNLLAASAMLLTVVASCDTEYNTIYNDIPGDVTYVSGDAIIKSFTIQEHADQQPIQAAIVNDTIKIVWVSYYAMPKTITPNIVLAEKAVISPKSAVEIPFKNGETYTVTSEAGTIKKYTLKVDFRQPQPKAFVGEATGTLGGWTSIVNSGLGGIDDLWLNLEQTRVYLVSGADQKTEYDCEIAYFGKGTGTTPFRDYGIYFYLPVNAPVGKYDLRIKNGEYILRDSKEANWFNFTVTESTTVAISTFTAGFSVVAGGTFKIRGTKLDTGTSIYISVGTAGTRYPLEIVSRTAYEAVLKVPAGTPAGTYNRYFFTDAAKETMVVRNFTVTP
ncbi:hypothetical protein [Flavobacterium notoginsengisoli]|uniref:hypothetical protein n=1 Tax=Flavobacterium notoginsengisoli TaxID=1478199 RepID=UPI00362CFC68